ncbi:hypothetical protein P5704_012135 [Pseudomonas sp. FeN3W]|nr:hypothetical protein P5704_012135 [Pseudomonas sp. FeN3W]
MAALLQRTLDTITRNQAELLSSWKSDLQSLGGYHNVKPEELAQQTADLIRQLISGTADGSADVNGPAWDGMRLYLEKLGIRNFWLIKCQRCKEENLSQRII